MDENKTLNNIINYINSIINNNWNLDEEESLIIEKLIKLKEELINNNIEINKDLLERLIEENDILKEYIKQLINYENKIDEEFIVELIKIYYELKEKEEEHKHKIIPRGLNQYFREISKIPLLTREEEIELKRRIDSGDEEARKKFIEANLKLVISVAKKYNYKGRDLDDLIEDGNIGLMRAINKFDPTKGYKFSTYAKWWIKQEIERSIEEHSKNIRIPSYQYENIRNYKKAEEKLLQEKRRKPTIEEMARELNITIEEVREIKKLQETNISLNKQLEDNDIELEEFIISDENIEDSAIENIIKKELYNGIKSSHLTKKELYVLVYRYGLFSRGKKTLEKIGDELNVTRERVRQIEIKAINKLLNNKSIVHLKTYLLRDDEALRYKEQNEKKDKELEDLFNKCNLSNEERTTIIYFYGLKNNIKYSIEEIAILLNESIKNIRNHKKTALMKIMRFPDNKITKEIMKKMKKKKKKKKNSDTIKRIDLPDNFYNIVAEVIKLPIFKDLMKDYKMNDAIIVLLYEGYYNNTHYSKKSLAKAFLKTEKDITDIIKKHDRKSTKGKELKKI